MEVGRVFVQDVHHFLRVACCRAPVGRSGRGPGRRSPATPTTAVPRRWCRQPGASVSCPIVPDGVIDGEAGGRRCVIGDVRGGSRRRRLRHHALLVGRLRLVGAGAAAAATPADLARPAIARAEGQGRPADGQNVWRNRRPFGGRAVVARGRHERYAGLVKILGVVRRLARELAAAPAHRHDIRMGRRVLDAGEQVAIAVGAGLDQHDARPGSHRVRPLHVERLLELPTARRIAGRITRPAGLVDPRDRRGGQPELGIERVQIGLDVRVVVGIDDGDRLAAAIARDATEGNIIKSICYLDLCRRVRPGRRLTAASQGADLERRVGHQHQRRRAEQRARFEMINSRPQGTLRRGARSERPTHCSRAHRRNLRVVHRSCGFKAACSTWKPARPEERADHTKPRVQRSRRDSCEKPTQRSPGHR